MQIIRILVSNLFRRRSPKRLGTGIQFNLETGLKRGFEIYAAVYKRLRDCLQTMPVHIAELSQNLS